MGEPGPSFFEAGAAAGSGRSWEYELLAAARRCEPALEAKRADTKLGYEGARDTSGGVRAL